MEEHLEQHGVRWHTAAANREVWKRKRAEWASAEHERICVKRRASGQPIVNERARGGKGSNHDFEIAKLTVLIQVLHAQPEGCRRNSRRNA